MKILFCILFLMVEISGCSVVASPEHFNVVDVKEYDLNSRKVLHVSGAPQASALAVEDVVVKKGSGDARLYVYLNSPVFLPRKKRSGVLDCSFYVDDDVDLIYFGDSHLVIWERR